MSQEESRQFVPKHKEEEERDADNSGDDGFYNRGGNENAESDEDVQAPGRKARKAKHIKKRKKRGEPSKKQHLDSKKKQHTDAAREVAKKIIREMKACEEKDEKLLHQNKKASNKLVYAIKMQKELHNVYVCEQFLQHNGLEYLYSWVKRSADGIQSPLTLRKKVFNIILSLNANDEHIERAPEMKKFIQKGKRNPYTKDLCEAIISRWGDGGLM